MDGGESVDVLHVSPSPNEALGEDGGHEVPECMFGRCWEVQESEVLGSSVRGRLKSCLAFWKDELGAPP